MIEKLLLKLRARDAVAQALVVRRLRHQKVPHETEADDVDEEERLPDVRLGQAAGLAVELHHAHAAKELAR